jgi:hypothetical protein
MYLFPFVLFISHCFYVATCRHFSPDIPEEAQDITRFSRIMAKARWIFLEREKKTGCYLDACVDVLVVLFLIKAITFLTRALLFLILAPGFWSWLPDLREIRAGLCFG